ncbi:metallophosphoesterase [Ammoniphilus sp. CFH 90114]|uniref:metallophosphoesterase n=1 Tax=Ammoniphilus sp. CFH 90114 TaxID=2493665 RepID=UPI00100FEA92|nr:metallophosphoesterase [Ammoniphilus sp. CFH 90114]RXT06545.1 metallophosphoesterase [Ammoniphilus sp. CFH 90114]
MWGIITTVFLGLYGLMSYYIGSRGWYTLGKQAPRPYQILYWIFFLLLILSFPLAELGEEVLPITIAPVLTIWGGYSMVAVSYLFLLLLVTDLIRLLDKRIAFLPVIIRDHKKTPLTLGFLLVCLVLIVVVYGSWNARNPIVKEYDLTVYKNAGPLDQLHIALVSDLHYGPIIDTKRIERMVEMVKDLQPDIILLAGDITDGSLLPEQGAKLAAVLARLQSPMGTYIVPGNHDRDLRDDQSELMNELIESGITVLKDNYITIGDHFHLIGRDDPNRRRGVDRMELEELLVGTDPSKPLILLDHQPLDLSRAQELGIDLQLSGHTHRGQIFPANLITGQIYEIDWGLLKKDAYHLIVSSGFGTWGPPLRIGNRPEVVSIKIDFH